MTSQLIHDRGRKMHPLPDVPELQALARRVVWFKSPSDAIAMPVHFIAQC